ncbi:hypothetical protein BC937DRAFT_90530 [Endogone sp. FLAS-F59071]|nr:hypothetical protein BC937DRAFT_90530 [Endogone sp. FLAS-F59071]|eukprot:RUS17020.1 hypothetical protein BC937DRAFT_90530 [Endogone sp. FLAS-F59071]
MPWSVDGVTTGIYLVVKGITFALSNPNIHKTRFLRTVFYLLATSIIIYFVSRLLVGIPISILRFTLRLTTSAKKTDNSRLDSFLSFADDIVRDGIMSVPLVGVLFIRYLYPKPLDDLFMDSIRFVDEKEALPEGRKPYAPALAKYGFKIDYWGNFLQYLKRTFKRLRLSLFVYTLTFLPLVGRFVVPIASAYTVIGSLGLYVGLTVGVCSLILPSAYSITILSSLFAMRGLTRELLEPYFARMALNTSERATWFRRREDVIFGFSAIAYMLVRVPMFSVLGFGVAQAAAAYLLVHITEPPEEKGLVTEEGKEGMKRRVTKGKVVKEEKDEDIPTLDVRGAAQQGQGNGREHGQFMQFPGGFPQGQFRMYQG